MCGIGGIRRYKGGPIEEYQIRGLLLGLEHRGNDATGIALYGADGIKVLKEDCPANLLVNRPSYTEFLEDNLDDHTWFAMVHTRAATKGSPRKNVNNHPMWDEINAVVHNGVIHNDDTLFRELHAERVAETDSDILRAIVAQDGLTLKAVRTLNRVSGSVAMCAISEKYPDTVLLARSGSPVVMATYNNGEKLVFASEKHLIHKAMRPWIYQHGLPFQQQKLDLAYLTMANDQAYIFGPDGLEHYADFKTAYQFTQPTYTRVHEFYEERQRRFNTEVNEERMPQERQLCPNPNCRVVFLFKLADRNTPLNRWYCIKCGANLATGVINASKIRKK